MIIYYDNGKNGIFRSYFRENGLEYHQPYRNLTGFEAAQVKGLNLVLPFGLMYRPLPELPDKEDVIVFDTKIRPRYLRKISSFYSGRRLIYWLWNPVRDKKQLDRVPKTFEIWTYSGRDARKYHLKQNHQFYFDSLVKKYSAAFGKTAGIRKYVFAGRNKGREPQLKDLEARLMEAGASCCLYIEQDRRWGGYTREPVLPYPELIRLIGESDGLLDIYTDPEAGYSLRVMEALFFDKKLITNNRLITGEDFYREENIFVIGESAMSLAEFIERPLCPVSEKIKRKYLLSSWLSDFGER